MKQYIIFDWRTVAQSIGICLGIGVAMIALLTVNIIALHAMFPAIPSDMRLSILGTSALVPEIVILRIIVTVARHKEYVNER
jgi:hypothetical protein